MQSATPKSSNNLMITIYVIFFAGLTSVAVWDVTEIIRDYIEDNRFTLIKTKNSLQDGFPFLNKSLIYLNYDRPIIPGITWADFTAMLNDSWHQRDIVWLRNMSDADKSMCTKLFDTIMFSLIKYVDEGYSRIPVMVDLLGISREEIITLTDRFINNTQNVDIIRRTRVDKIFTSRFVEAPGEYHTSNDIIVRDIVYTKNLLVVCVSVPLADDLMTTRTDKQQVYAVDLSGNENNNITDIPVSKNARIYLFDDFQRVEKLIPDTRIDYIIKIMNSQILDSRRFPPCTTEYRSENDCINHLRRFPIESVCDCQQFSNAVTINRSVDNVSNDRKPFCTMQMYETCMEKANEEYKRRKKIAIEERTCVPCLSATNAIIVYTGEIYFYDRPFTLIFECAKDTYLVFEEKPQFSFSQLVSQIGGDLGLYIGFSMISILQLILFFYQIHRQRRNSDVESSSTKCGEWFQFCLQYVARSFKSIDKENSIQLLRLSDDFQKFQSDTTKQLLSIEQKLEQLLGSRQSNSAMGFSEFNTENHYEIQHSKF